MRRSTPYLQRRGYGLTFRIAVPLDLRLLVGGREITKALPTAIRNLAATMALDYAACVKRIFHELRTGTVPVDPEKLKAKIIELKRKLEISNLKDEHLDELFQQKIEQIGQIKLVKLQTEIEVLRSVMAKPPTSARVALALPPPAPTPPSVPAPVTVVTSPTISKPVRPMVDDSPLLSELIEAYLRDPATIKKRSLLTKLNNVLPTLDKIIGIKQVSMLRQVEIRNALSIIQKLPKGWVPSSPIPKVFDKESIAEATFKSGKVAPLRLFLDWCIENYSDQGFPMMISVGKAEYVGDKKGQQQKQRALTVEELKRLFEGPEMKAFANDPKMAHRFWLPTIGLFTGARVNEICQMNPQADIVKDAKTGVHYFLISEKTESDERVIKAIKKKKTLRIPVHNKLLELGILEYVNRVKGAGAKLMFPEWAPVAGRAATTARDWFSDFLKTLEIHGIKDEDGLGVHGMHAFRSTLLTYGLNQKPQLILDSITGHSPAKSLPIGQQAAKYLTESLLSPIDKKAALLNQLDYGITFHVPVTP